MEEKNNIWGYILVAVVTIVIGVGIGLGISYLVKDTNNTEITKNNNLKGDSNEQIDKDENDETKEINCSDTEIKNTLSIFLDLQAKNEYAPAQILTDLGLLTTEILSNKLEDSEGYVHVNISYLDFKNSMLKYMTEELFNQTFTVNFKETNSLGEDKLKYFDGGGSGYEKVVKNISNINGNMYSAEITVINTVAEPQSEYTKNIKFEIKEVNNKCVISSIDIK